MRNIKFSFLFILVWLLTLSFSISAQDRHKREDNHHREPKHGSGQRRPGILTAEMLSDGKVVKGAPYTAVAIRERVQILDNGTRISHQTTDTFVRDSEGRTRHEATQDGFGPFAIKGKATTRVFIHDVVAKKRFALDPDHQTANKISKVKSAPPPDFAPPASSNQKTESLGKQMIEGVEVMGIRSTITIPAGEIGNDRPLEITSERWESPELQVVILSKHKDPRMGETIFRLTKINRVEPAKALFEVPANYKMIDDDDAMKNRGKHHKEED